MYISLPLSDTARSNIELPDDCLLSEPEIKQFLALSIKDLEQEEQDSVFHAFNEGIWEVLDDDGYTLFSGTPKRTVTPTAPPAEQNSLMSKIELLQETQSQIKQLEADIEKETADITARITAIEEKQAQVSNIKEQQRAISQELVELQKLLNELLNEETAA